MYSTYILIAFASTLALIAADGGGHRAGGLRSTTGFGSTGSGGYEQQSAYSAPASGPIQQAYEQPQQAYSAPQQAAYSAPQQAYSAPQQSYSQPQQTYSQPQQSYSQPQQSYSQPQASYSQPQQTYSQPQQGYGQQQSYPPMPYQFQYAVKDYYGNDYSQQEKSDGHNTEGEYRVLLPDGRTQIVSYRADHNTGYYADVKYEGEARYPEPVKSGYGAPQAQQSYGGQQQGGYASGASNSQPAYSQPQAIYEEPQAVYAQPQTPPRSYSAPSGYSQPQAAAPGGYGKKR